MYTHCLMRINYTTYDVRRGQDILNPRTSHRNIMGLVDRKGGEEIHPFWYAQVLGIYHANVVYIGDDCKDYRPTTLYFLWVRNFALCNDTHNAWTTRRMDRVQWMSAEEDAYDFIDPQQVLRGCHIISRYAAGCGRSGPACPGRRTRRRPAPPGPRPRRCAVPAHGPSSR